MLRPMFGMGMSEILVILLVAALFLGPEKLPDAATKISKGIRDLRRQTRDLQETIENDTELGGAIRDLKSALRGEDLRRPPVKKAPSQAALASVAAAAAAVEAAEQAALAPPDPELATDGPPAAVTDAAPAAAIDALAAATAAAEPTDEPAPPAVPRLTLSPTAGESGRDVSAAADDVVDEAAELARLVRPVSGAVKRDGHGPS